ncbi:MAG: NADH-quinone oxidoreductase subunit M [Chitinophagia bacterium]|jgi:NADH-quinone oxidoreductase subunit M|nr:NADH-quinone oxidoreductase subunit M [Chitinophagia bacterium]
MLLSFILIPFVTALLLLFIKKNTSANTIAIVSTLGTLVAAIVVAGKGAVDFNAPWIPVLNAQFLLHVDGLAKILVLLTAISFPAIIIATSQNQPKQKNIFLSLLLFTQSGLMGVFLSGDALLFYFFWELALIPVYFLSSIWGGEKRIAVTFKFFIYTFLGSLMMLIGIVFVYMHTSDQSFLIQSFAKANLTGGQQVTAFALFFIAFAIKMPIFPLHTWQPDAYEQSPTAVTMVMSAVMVKMGLYGILRWLLPLFPTAFMAHIHVVVILSVIGILYASFIAIRQDDIKRLIAYSSIAHIGLMNAAIFSHLQIGIQGVMVQLFSHGINVLGLWIVADIIEQQTGTRSMQQMGGLAKKQPTLAILLVGFALANIALPLTNAFVGEFLMFNSLFQYNVWVGAAAGVSIILAAIYTLNMVQKVAYGEVSTQINQMQTINTPAQIVLIVLLIIVFVTGVFPQPLFDLTADSLQQIIVK